jgi:outer membrane protein OmpA-like peptidoglycan-associated protein
MIRRDGLLRHAGVVTAAVVVAAPLASDIDTAQAAESHSTFESRTGPIEVPREILPWRRDIERRADTLLARAEHALATGHQKDGERLLEDLVRDYPKTYAGQAAKRRLERTRWAALWQGSEQRGALGVNGGVGSEDGDAIAISPVAGWQTVVRQGTASLHDNLIEAAGDRVFFQAGSAHLTMSAKRVLDKQARWLATQRHVEFKIVGHADDEGSGASNLRLSHDRAVAVRRYLVTRGISGNRLHVLSFGNAKPIAICTVNSCAAQNRRVVSEIRLRRQALGPLD